MLRPIALWRVVVEFLTAARCRGYDLFGSRNRIGNNDQRVLLLDTPIQVVQTYYVYRKQYNYCQLCYYREHTKKISMHLYAKYTAGRMLNRTLKQYTIFSLIIIPTSCDDTEISLSVKRSDWIFYWRIITAKYQISITYLIKFSLGIHWSAKKTL